MPDRHRLQPLLTIWGIALLAEGVLWWFFVRSSYFRDFFLPITVVVVIAALAASARVVQGRSGADRREGDRRHEKRRR